MSAEHTRVPAAPEVSVVIPVYNEELILASSVEELIENLSGVDTTFEIIIAENGSSDRTVPIAEELSNTYDMVRCFSIGEPNYGKALREGIFRARGEFVVCEEIDLCDVDFFRIALERLREGYDLVVGSKRAPGARDRRPVYRRAATHILNTMLRVAVGFQGTDTHGLKAFRRSALLDVVESCVVERDMFASEFVVRTHRSDRKWLEVPIDLVEKRPPSVHLFRRVPNVLKNIVRLTAIIRLGRDVSSLR